MKQLVSTEKIKALILPVLEFQDIDLVDIDLKGLPGNQVLRIFIDRENGVSLDLCTKVSRDVSDILDTEDIMKEKYRLEVSSPGFDRPLKTFKDFRRNVNRKIKIEYLNETNEQVISTGTIQTVDMNEVFLQEEKEIIKITLTKIQSAKILPLW
ncbi:ribosome maturation factor RimP [candidate division KSB1 bacterium]|nr:ribosome maturation factor RimP [candidate division KSB1 bacterium]MBL7094881.1 ribosome maturation factor RimP [candidate division KSB1 bacterium]